MVTQIVETPDGQRFFTIGRTAPAGRTLTVDETRKTISPFPFLGG